MRPEQIKILIDSSLPMFFDDGIEPFIEWRGKVVRYMVDIVNQAIAEERKANMPQSFGDLHMPLVLSENFGDPETLFNSREWLQTALEAKGAKIAGAGVGGGQADLSIFVDGCEFNVSIRPIIRSKEDK